MFFFFYCGCDIHTGSLQVESILKEAEVDDKGQANASWILMDSQDGVVSKLMFQVL